MNYYEKIKTNKFFKILLSLILIFIIFDKLIILTLLTLYYIIQKYVYNNPIQSPLTLIKKYINPQKRIDYYLENIGDFNNKYNFSKYNKQGFTNFEAKNNIANSLGQIFKHSELNFNHYPNVEIRPEKPLFSNNKFLPECCFYDNEYSTDKGCPCITPDQQYYLRRRGTNKHNSSALKDEKNYKNVFFSPTLALKGEEFPFNPLTSSEYNTYISPEFKTTDASINEFNHYTNNLSRGIL